MDKLSLKYLINKRCQTLHIEILSKLLFCCKYSCSLLFPSHHRFFPIAFRNKEVKETLASFVFHRRLFAIQLDHKAINLYDHMTKIRRTVGTLLICTMNPLMILDNFTFSTEPVIIINFCLRFCIRV